MQTRSETIHAADGTFAGHLVVPDSGSGPGLVVLQEIFGVNTYIRSVCDRVAALGYVALAPDMFWRQEPDFVVEPSEGEDGMNAAFARMGAFDWSHAAADLGAAVEHLAGLPECDGRVGVMGFCFGGTLTFHAAADLDPVCAVSYYGSGVAEALDAKAASVACPVLFQFGDDDPFLPNADVDAVRAALGDRPDIEIEVQAGAGHAFDNHTSPVFSNPDAASAAWSVTEAFLARHLPVT